MFGDLHEFSLYLFVLCCKSRSRLLFGACIVCLDQRRVSSVFALQHPSTPEIITQFFICKIQTSEFPRLKLFESNRLFVMQFHGMIISEQISSLFDEIKLQFRFNHCQSNETRLSSHVISEINSCETRFTLY
jgi:hypothetical protein